jgi:hypothetical protein
MMGFGGIDITPKGIAQIKTTLPTGWKSVTLKELGSKEKHIQ